VPADMPPPHGRSSTAILDDLDVRLDDGLTKRDVQQRRQRFGRNRLRESRQRNIWLILLDQLKSVVILIMVIAAVLAYLHATFFEFRLPAVLIIGHAPPDAMSRATHTYRSCCFQKPLHLKAVLDRVGLAMAQIDMRNHSHLNLSGENRGRRSIAGMN